jgi:hypothetical protein
MDEDRIKICGINECTICGKEFKYRFLKWRFPETPDGLWDIQFKTEHPNCLAIKRRIDKLNSDIDKLLYERIDLEFTLFSKKY